MSAPKNRYEEWIDNLLSRRAIAATVLGFVVVGGFLAIWRPAKEFAEDVGWTTPKPHLPGPQVPLPGLMDTERLEPVGEQIEFTTGASQPVLQRDGETIVALEWAGNSPWRALNGVLVAAFDVRIQGRTIGAPRIEDYIQIESAYDRSSLSGHTHPVLLIEGDVVTILGDRFIVDRVWHRDPLGRGFGDPSSMVRFVAIR